MTAAEPARVEALLLDAGGVLLDLDYAYLRRLIRPRRADVDVAELARAEALSRREIDDAVRRGGNVAALWRDYFATLLGHVGVPATGHDPIIDSLWEAHRRVGLWTVAVPGAAEALAALRGRGLRLGVVSNAEGQVARDLESAGYGGMFETVVDSRLVGVAKPDPAIFAIALERMRLRPERVAYLGDVPAVDVAGARAAAIRPLLLDRHDLYPDADVPRLRSFEDLARVVVPQNCEA